MVRPIVESQLRERDPELGGPPGLADLCPSLPHRIEFPVTLVFVVCRMEMVEPHTGGGDAEGVRRSPVKKRVKRHEHILSLSDVIPTAERGLDRLTGLAVHPRADVERLVVEREADVHPVGRGGALERFLLNEVGHWRGG